MSHVHYYGDDVSAYTSYSHDRAYTNVGMTAVRLSSAACMSAVSIIYRIYTNAFRGECVDATRKHVRCSSLSGDSSPGPRTPWSVRQSL